MSSGAAFVAEMQHSSKVVSQMCQFNTFVLTTALAHSQWDGG